MMMGFGLLVLLVLGGGLIAVLVGGAGLASRAGALGQSASGPRQPKARQVLDERLARGEIGPEEYKALREQIEQ